LGVLSFDLPEAVSVFYPESNLHKMGQCTTSLTFLNNVAISGRLSWPCGVE